MDRSGSWIDKLKSESYLTVEEANKKQYYTQLQIVAKSQMSKGTVERLCSKMDFIKVKLRNGVYGKAYRPKDFSVKNKIQKTRGL